MAALQSISGIARPTRERDASLLNSPATGRARGPFETLHALPIHRGVMPRAISEEPLMSVALQVERDLAADGVLVTWHADGQDAAFLFASGACEPQSDAEREMLIEACAVAAADQPFAVRWAPRSDEAATELLTTRIAADSGVVTITGLFRLLSEKARSAARESATRSLPMMQAFFRLWSTSARTEVANRGLTAALNSSDVATLLVDAGGRCVFANVAAERILARDNGLRRAGAMLGGSRLSDTMRLQAAIEHVVHADGAMERAVPVIALHRKGGRPLLAAVVAADRRAGDVRAVAGIVHVFDPDQDIESLLGPVCKLYGLSAGEARLTALLATGMTLAEAAKAMRIQEQTARSYLKQIFLKTDTNRQTELVLLALKGAVRTAPGSRTNLL